MYLDFVKMVLNWGFLLPSIQKKKCREFRLKWLSDCSDFSFFFLQNIEELEKGHAISRVRIIRHERSYAQYPISFPRSKFNQVSTKKKTTIFFSNGRLFGKRKQFKLYFRIINNQILSYDLNGEEYYSKEEKRLLPTTMLASNEWKWIHNIWQKTASTSIPSPAHLHRLYFFILQLLEVKFTSTY